MDVKMLGQYHKMNFRGIRPVKEKPHIENWLVFLVLNF
jgi:hypothetical protein